MKKSLYLSLAFAAMLGFSACDDGDYADWSNPMTSEQEALYNAVDVTATAVASTIDWASELGETVKVVDAKATEGYDVKYELQFSDDNVLPLDASGCVVTEDLKKEVESLFGKAPVERELEANVVAYVSKNGVSVKKSVPVVIKALLTAPHISENYYIVGGPNDWAGSCASKELKFIHSSENVYDDPNFSIVFPAAAEGDTWFAIGDDEACDAVANENVWNKLLGTTSGNGKNGEEGKLAPRYELEDDGSFMVPAGAKFIKVDLNMLDGTYKVASLNFEKYLWVPGNAQGWNPASAGRIVSENYDGVYKGFVYVDGGFKFTSQADWNGTNYGIGDGDGTVSATGGDFSWEAGVYYVTVDLVNMTYSSTKVEKMGLIGGFNDWGDDVLLDWNVEKSCFYGDCSAVTSAGWKFRVNADWAINLGGKSLADLVADGANLTATGSYIELYPLRLEGVSETIYAAMDGETPVVPDVPTDLPEYLWTPGNANGWSHAGACRLYSADKDGNFEGFIYVDGDFKFTSQADWNGTNYGAGEEGLLSEDGGAGNLNLGTGVFFVKVNILDHTYTATAISNMNLVGSFNGWNAADDAQTMTWNAAELCYEKADAGVSADGWKFTANNAWDINLGGTLDNLTGNGDNLTVVGSTIKLYPCRNASDNIYCTVE